MDRPDRPLLLSARGIAKSYAAPVLADVDFSVAEGEVHALMGANGAGKSTLSRIITGMTQADAGAMTLSGEPYAPADRLEAERMGVQMVLQELNLVGTLTVAENLFLTRLPRRMGFVRSAQLTGEARHVLDAFGLQHVDPSAPASTLGVGTQQLVEIAGALARECRLLILDEPTAALTNTEAEMLFGQIDRLKRQGVGVVYISHRMEEIARVADRISVLRDGKMVATRPAAGFEREEIVRLMAGEGRVSEHQAVREFGEILLRVEGLSCGNLVRDVSLEVRRGEILGIAGLVGSGRTELLRAIYGADPPEGGHVYLRGEDRPLRIRQPRDAVRAGIGMVPEDRKQDGLLLPRSIQSNMLVGLLGRFSKAGWLRGTGEEAAAGEMRAALDLQCRSLGQTVAELSGGNQQKVVLARWLLQDCDVLLFDEPTRGIDVGAKALVYRLLHDLAGAGKGLIVVSSEMEELFSIADRIAVLSAGQLTATFDRGEWSQELVMEAALKGYTSAAA